MPQRNRISKKLSVEGAASLLKKNLDNVMSLWEVRTRQTSQGLPCPDSTALRNHLPEYLEEVVKALETNNPQFTLVHYTEVSARHAQNRASLPGYTIDRVLSEYIILYKIIRDTLKAEAPLSDQVHEIILNAIHVAMKESASEFTRLQTQKIEQLVSRLNLAAESTSIGFWELDITSNRFWRSHTLDQILGQPHSESEWGLETFLQFIDPRDRDLVQGALISEDVFECEFRVNWPDGTLHWILQRSKAYKCVDGKVIRLLAAVTDISGRKHQEEERSQLLLLLQTDLEKVQLDREVRQRFVTTITHDLRSPLSAVQSGIELLLTHSGDAEWREHLLKIILNGVKRADKMIQDLLDANRLRAGQKLPIHVGMCDLFAMTEKILCELSLVHGNRFRIVATQPIEGYWDCNGLRRVIENLLNNAVKYGSSDTPITVVLEGNENTIHILVHNYGKEIPREEQATLFEPFQRTLDSKANIKEGWGIGLTVVRGVAEAHGGRIYIESESQKGTTFIVELPKDTRNIALAG